jgi:hypothetical protein
MTQAPEVGDRVRVTFTTGMQMVGDVVQPHAMIEDYETGKLFPSPDRAKVALGEPHGYVVVHYSRIERV